ncbi:type IV pilus modification protein PilV [Saccharophagus degradans]|uniref:Tfp pilus assembly protein PilV-like protein n=1 Tax=Saccharophagus degradans (strain 2-40 / ATCC 43961 / DSM 17024) TaxID=203122 RepID=Q21HK8_SACD2|nr:type IV pilus modification protein PilV [Saccharophagus degradans]ABD81821.1 Tfp pilus assembly protein PilV-like protein [Saccharophagus degradans 2-40]
MVKCVKSQNGSSLIEVMVALFVLAIGMLGVLAMQTRAIQMNQNSAQYSQATTLAADIYEAMLTSPSSPGSYTINFDDAIPAAPACTASTSECSPSQIAAWNKHHWLTNVQNLLPGGEGQIEASGDKEYVISIRFVTGYDKDTDEPVYEQVDLDVRI